MTSCEHQEILSHGLISCWNRKLSHRFLGLFDCFTCSFILCGNSTEFPEQPVHHSNYKWFQSNLEGVNRRAYDKNLSKRCSVQWETVERVRVVLPCSLRIDTAVWVHTCRTGPVFWGQQMAKENFALPSCHKIEDLLQLTLKGLNWEGDVLERQVWSTISTDMLVLLGFWVREWSVVLWFGRFRGKKTGKNHLFPLIVCLIHLTRSGFNRSSYINVDTMNVL